MLISAFPGTGKSTFFKKYASRFSISDSDSSQFSKDGFPSNYIIHIADKMDEYGPEEDEYAIFISSHKEVREALSKHLKSSFYLIYPNVGLKAEYMRRYRERGSPDSFLNVLNTNWENWIEECKDDRNAEIKIELLSGQFINDVMVINSDNKIGLKD